MIPKEQVQRSGQDIVSQVFYSDCQLVHLKGQKWQIIVICSDFIMVFKTKDNVIIMIYLYHLLDYYLSDKQRLNNSQIQTFLHQDFQDHLQARSIYHWSYDFYLNIFLHLQFHLLFELLSSTFFFCQSWSQGLFGHQRCYRCWFGRYRISTWSL